jgi:hypothetical protein
MDESEDMECSVQRWPTNGVDSAAHARLLEFDPRLSAGIRGIVN